MDDFGVPLGRWFGIPIVLHWSWVLICGMFAVSDPKFAMVYASVFFIVLLHELGHCFANKCFNMHVEKILIYPFGGVASMELPQKAYQEAIMAIAGPFVNVLLIPPLFLLKNSFPNESSLSQIFNVNFMLLVFNLLPAFPMDGGRVLRSLLAMWWNDHIQATVVAARIGQFFCILFGVVGFMYGNFMLAIIGGVIFLFAERELQLALNTKRIKHLHSIATDSPYSTTSENEISKSAKMLEEIQRKTSFLDAD